MGTTHLSELTDRTGQSVNQMRHFEDQTDWSGRAVLANGKCPKFK